MPCDAAVCSLRFGNKHEKREERQPQPNPGKKHTTTNNKKRKKKKVYNLTQREVITSRGADDTN